MTMSSSHRSTVRRLINGVALTLFLATCGAANAQKALVIDGVEIAPADVWAAAQKEGKFEFYSALPEVRAKPLLDAFKKATGISTSSITLTGTKMSQRVISEHAAGVLVADVILGSDPAIVAAMAEKGVFQKFCPPHWDDMSTGLKDKDCYWWTAFSPVYAIVYNSALVTPEQAPKTWGDLLKPEWKGKIAYPWIGNGGSTWSRDLFLRETYGVEYWQKLAAQNPRIVDSSGASMDLVKRGEVPIGLTVAGNVTIARKSGEAVGLVLPSDGVPAYGDMVGLTTSAKNANAGKVFLSWLASPIGQKAVADLEGDYPASVKAPGPFDGAGGRLPNVQDAKLVFPETYPNYASVKQQYKQEWLDIFKYAP
jgi:iron(III) transport system substrate-binding protein